MFLFWRRRKVPASAAAAEFPGKSEHIHGAKTEMSGGTNKYICRERGGELGARKQGKLNKGRKESRGVLFFWGGSEGE